MSMTQTSASVGTGTLFRRNKERKMARVSLEGQNLGRYRILEPLGQGGMARVYRAYHPQLDRFVAIKVMRSDLVDDDEFLARFQREARAVANLRHPNITQVHDFDVEDDVYYMVMELLEGDTLKTRLNSYRVRGEQMPWGEIVRIVLDVLDGLAYAHSEGMIHRDIKPANILLTQRGQAVVGDFGITHIIGGTHYTATDALMGTLAYMAPEQGMEGRSDARSDIYALGVVLYEMLTQRKPFEAETPLAILMKHVNDPLPLPRQINPEIPEALERIVLKAMAKQPEDRYAGAAAMAVALRAAADEAGIELPRSIALPTTFQTEEAPAESVAVISGTQRQKLAVQEEMATRRFLDRTFAKDDTAITQGNARGDEPGTAPTTGEGRPRRRPQDVTKGVLIALGIVALGNLMAVTISSFLNNWAIFERGWAMELLWAGGALFILMAIANALWLSIPAGLIVTNGLILTYCSFTGNWHHWAFLWVLEPWVLAATILVTKKLAREPDNARRITHLLGWAGGATSILAAIIVQGSALGFEALSRLAGWFS
jgi:serine/threonine-protein kinase